MPRPVLQKWNTREGVATEAHVRVTGGVCPKDFENRIGRDMVCKWRVQFSEN